ncbi:glutaredoxin [Saprolegnia diclina VS20]|uniref:Glutaredoxin n=1 Tax=Saprolegnia diclina (strain VS20) TaxID=1156394 RepID=T0QLV1_SAPDV|nr:glutaredoxin [Saprolegnia diclina VS20]EQC39024.1 glutaredoxin [Saprolegnia diclina VS20]|eukprot:XP_008607848.1 glutaredoxin [Saprolegnia diclina VS20]
MSVYQRIQREIDTHTVMLYIKGTREAPEAGFSSQVVAVFRTLDVDFGVANLLECAELRQAIKDFSNWPTIPQIFIRGKFLGGSDTLLEMYKSGELERILGLSP